jgi:hypothetical protein
MSTYYRPIRPIQMSELFSGRLKKYGIYDDSIGDARRLAGEVPGPRVSKGTHFIVLHVTPGDNDNDTVAEFASYNEDKEIDPHGIIAAIADEFDTEIVSQHDPRYWGYNNFRDWNAAFYAQTSARLDAAYKEIIHYVEGKPCDLTNIRGRRRAQIGQRLIKKYSELSTRYNCADLIRVIDAISMRDIPTTQFMGYSKRQIRQRRARFDREVDRTLALALGRVTSNARKHGLTADVAASSRRMWR